MAPSKCEQCGREFMNDLALKIHVGRQHGSKAKPKAARKRGRKRAKATAAPKGATTCMICGRSFKLPLHLGRHMAASHNKAKRGRPARRIAARRIGARRGPGRPKAVVGVNVRNMPVDQLLSLKMAVDARLTEIARRMRQARVGI